MCSSDLASALDGARSKDMQRALLALLERAQAVEEADVSGTGDPSGLVSTSLDADAAPDVGVKEGAWSCCPSADWLNSPITGRPLVGHSLIDLARRRNETGDWTRADQEGRPEMVIHAGDSVRVGAVNVGFRGLAASGTGVVQLIQHTCCDILFLSDLRTTHGKIGRPRRAIEAALRDEWRLLTDIPESEERPVRMGALIHASLASQIGRAHV